MTLGGGDYAAYSDYPEYGEHLGQDGVGRGVGGSYHPNFHHHSGFVEHGAHSPQSPSDRSNSPSLPPVTPRSAKNSGRLITGCWFTSYSEL